MTKISIHSRKLHRTYWWLELWLINSSEEMTIVNYYVKLGMIGKMITLQIPLLWFEVTDHCGPHVRVLLFRLTADSSLYLCVIQSIKFRTVRQRTAQNKRTDCTRPTHLIAWWSRHIWDTPVFFSSRSRSPYHSIRLIKSYRTVCNIVTKK